MTDRTQARARAVRVAPFFLLLALLLLPSIVTVASRRQPPGREEAYRQNNVGVAHLERYDFKSAVVAFRRALQVDPSLFPPPPAGWTNTFFLLVDGFSKEMNLHSGSPDQVEPLPFHAMSGYPYPALERYPESPEHQQYRATYNTRVIGRQLPPLETIATPVSRHTPQR